MSSEKSKNVPSELGTRISSGFGSVFAILLMKLFCIFGMGRPRVLSKFPARSEKNKSELGTWILYGVGGFFRTLLMIGFLHVWRKEAQGT